MYRPGTEKDILEFRNSEIDNWNFSLFDSLNALVVLSKRKVLCALPLISAFLMLTCPDDAFFK
jgi:hypothetical protein